MKKIMVRSLLTLIVLSFAIIAVSAHEGGNHEGEKQELAEGQAVVTLKIEGMTCDGCCTKVEAAANELEGVVAVKADYEAGTATITYNENEVTVKKIVKTINEKTSFKASV